LQAAQRANPTKRREDALRRNLLRIRKSIERLLTAYQEGLISLDELRQRMPDLRMHEQTDQAERQAIADQSAQRTACLRLAETVTDFLIRLRSSAGTLDVSERQRVLRLLVKDILVGDDKIVIRHSIPLPTNPSGGGPQKADSPGPSPTQSESYLLRSGRHHRALTRPLLLNRHDPVFEDTGSQPFLDEPEDACVADPVLKEADNPLLGNLREERPDISVE
jgi:site-specific DNA recombinase